MGAEFLREFRKQAELDETARRLSKLKVHGRIFRVL